MYSTYEYDDTSQYSDRTATMNDVVSTARSPALRQIYAVIAAGGATRDIDRVHPHNALTLLRQVRFGALHLPANAGHAARRHRGGDLSF
jgi:hypothetical protein